MKLSAIIIAKNAEKQIADAIQSLSFADEIILIDNGSEDVTLDVAKKMGAKVYLYKATDFADARNYGLRKAKGEWVLYIDTDERVTQELTSNIKYVLSKKEEGQSAAYRIKRRNFYFGNHEWPYIEKLERLFKKKNLKGWYGQLHESPKIDGLVGELEGFLLHYTHQNLDAMVEKTIAWSKVEADLRLDSNHPKMTWWRFPRVMITAFFNSYVRQQGWKAGTAGLVESIFQSFSMFITYARLWELQQNSKK